MARERSVPRKKRPLGACVRSKGQAERCQRIRPVVAHITVPVVKAMREPANELLFEVIIAPCLKPGGKLFFERARRAAPLRRLERFPDTHAPGEIVFAPRKVGTQIHVKLFAKQEANAGASGGQELIRSKAVATGSNFAESAKAHQT
jgi:hypothetical protein